MTKGKGEVTARSKIIWKKWKKIILIATLVVIALIISYDIAITISRLNCKYINIEEVCKKASFSLLDMFMNNLSLEVRFVVDLIIIIMAITIIILLIKFWKGERLLELVNELRI